jgi:LysR family transcriptional regulator, glycine cleavage system transcriptional activator
MAATDRLPSIASLIAFEHAARELSFKRAAQHVHVSPSALSRQLKALEDELGCALFRRGNPGLELTPAGLRYLAVVTRALDQLRAAQRELAARSGPLRISALQSFCEQWLIPHLPEFAQLYPEIEIELEATLRYADFDREPVDAAIRFGLGGWGELHSEPLLDLQVVPVCSPELLTREPALREPRDLAQHTLIHIAQVPDAWSDWLASVGLPQLQARRGLRFDHVALVLSAAESSLGVALCPRLLCERKLREGTLCRPFDHVLSIPSTYHFVCRVEALSDPRVARLRDWLVDSLAVSNPA